MSARLDDAARVRLRSDAEALLGLLNLVHLGAHQPCRLCGSSDAMSTKQSGDGSCFFKCFSCGNAGDYIRAYALIFNISDGEAMRRIAESARVRVTPRHFSKPTAKPATPRDLDSEGARAREWAMDLEHNNAALALLWRTRGITEDAATRWGLGVKDIRRGAGGEVVGCTWTIPILSPEPPRCLIGVKLHRHNPPPGSKKAGWLVGGGTALFPLLEAFNLGLGATIILAPGELKALAFVSAGVPATAPTTGESMSLKSWERIAPRFAGVTVRIDPDREDTKAAKDFEINAATALLLVASSVEVCQ